ncbi:gliding motility-associated C-terminal domain-containing protein [Elusimicrobiota bacterium]
MTMGKTCKWVLLILAGVLASARPGFAPPTNMGFNFSPTNGVSGKIFTPNGDGANDKVFFSFSNPYDSQVELSVYDVTGAVVRTGISSYGINNITWDGKDTGGRFVRSGIYIYQLRGEGKAYNGTVIVAR